MVGVKSFYYYHETKQNRKRGEQTRWEKLLQIVRAVNLEERRLIMERSLENVIGILNWIAKEYWVTCLLANLWTSQTVVNYYKLSKKEMIQTLYQLYRPTYI